MIKKLFLSVAVLLSAACSPQRDICAEIKASTLPFVQTAFSMETQAVLDASKLEGICEEGGLQLILIKYDSKKIVLFQGGVGPEKSMRSAETVLSSYKVKVLVFSGIAGAVDRNLKVGQTLIPAEWMLIDGSSFPVNGRLLKLADVQKQVRGVSIDHFLTDTKEIPVNLGVSIVDMESTFVAQVATKYQVLFIAVRSVSDMANGEKDKSHYEVAANASAAATLNLISALEKTP